MAALLDGKEPQPFKGLKSVDDFIDGFQLAAPPGFTARQLDRLLKDKGLEVLYPQPQRSPGRFWIRLAGGPYDLAHNIPLLREVAEELHWRTPTDDT